MSENLDKSQAADSMMYFINRLNANYCCFLATMCTRDPESKSAPLKPNLNRSPTAYVLVPRTPEIISLTASNLNVLNPLLGNSMSSRSGILHRGIRILGFRVCSLGVRQAKTRQELEEQFEQEVEREDF